MIYEFQEKLEEGIQYELELDDYFCSYYWIRNADMTEQRREIDRIYKNRRTGMVWAVEYKADTTAASSGNAFIETVSVDNQNKDGWFYTSSAQFMMYYIPPTKKLYVVDMVELKSNEREVLKYKIRTAKNQGYNTVGVIIPLKDFRKFCRKILQLPPT